MIHFLIPLLLLARMQLIGSLPSFEKEANSE